MIGKKLSLGTKLGFGICDLGGNLFFTMMGFYLLNFMTDTVKLLPALAGISMTIGKIADAITDPSVGFLSDRTKSKMGRRRPWMFWGAIFLFITMIIQYTNPQIQNQAALCVYMAVAYILLTTAYTMVNIPYGALTPELTQDFDERTALNAWRMTFAVVGTFVGALAVMPIVGVFPTVNWGWTGVGGIMGALMLGSAMVTIFTVKEPPRAKDEATEQQGLFSTYKATLSNKPFVLTMVTYALHICGTAVVQGALIYYFKYIYGPAGNLQIALALLLLPVIPFNWIWAAVSKRIGKKWAWNIGMAEVLVALMVLFLFARQAGPTFFYIVVFFAGMGLSTNYVMPYSIIPDTVELDYALHGVRREGAFYGLFNFMNKVGVALANLLNGIVLAWFGYVANTDQTEHAKLGIQLLVGPLSGVFFLAGVIVISFYPISRKYYQEQIMPKVAEWDAKRK